MLNITIYKIESPLGIINVGASNNGICMLEFDNENGIETAEEESIKPNFISEKIENKFIQSLKIQLDEYFNKKRKTFDVPLDLFGTTFQKKVWKELKKIPFGATRTYKQQAIAIGNLKAIRAVATANGANKILILIPCHRVIGSDGSLTGFRGGLWRKKFLLELESQQKNLLFI